MTQIKVHDAIRISEKDLHEHPNNSNVQSKHVFNNLKESIKENGFDETLLVIPRAEGGYTIMSGNHRFRAGKEVGMTEFPCVVRTDWDELTAEYESVKRNYGRGELDKKAFTAQVDRLTADLGADLEEVYHNMGFKDAQEFSHLYEREKQLDAEMAKKVMDTSTSAQAVKMIDDIGNIVSTILAEYGHTVPHSFLIFPAGAKTHLYVAANPALKAKIQAIAEQAVAQRLDMNVALAGLLEIGMAATNFLKGKGTKEIEAEGTVDPGEGDEFGRV
jgi:hypothetical protein